VTRDLGTLVPLFAQNYHVVKKFWTSDATRQGSAFLYACGGGVLDPAWLKQLSKMVRKQSGRFADEVDLVTGAAAAGFADPFGGIHLMKMAWDMLKGRPFSSGPYLSLAAVVLAEHAPAGHYGLVAQRARDCFVAQRAYHSFVTSHDDYLPSVLLALTPMDVPTLGSVVEGTYRRFKPWFGHNETQALAQVLVAGGALEMDPGRLLAVLGALNRADVKIVAASGVSALGALAQVSADHDWLAASVAGVSRHLGALKVPTGMFAKGARDTLAMLLVATAVGDGAQEQLARAVLYNTVARTVAEEQAATRAYYHPV